MGRMAKRIRRNIIEQRTGIRGGHKRILAAHRRRMQAAFIAQHGVVLGNKMFAAWDRQQMQKLKEKEKEL